MTLDPSYLSYAKRRRGMDHDLYPWSNMFSRSPIKWSGGKSVAVWIVVNLEWFPILPNDTPFRAPGHMQTNYPDFRHYTSREYGTRIGMYRLLDAFAAAGAKVSVAANSAIATRYPELIGEVVAAGHEIIAHATDMNGTIATGLAEDSERNLIRQSLDTLERAAGGRPRGWHSIARSQSWNTPRLLAEAGVEFMCDWVNDELPFAMHTPVGPLVNLPLNHELSDRQIIVAQQHSVHSYVQQVQDACRWLEDEARTFGGRMLPLAVTPYILGLPYRIAAFADLLGWLAERPTCAFSTGGAIFDDWRADMS